MKRKILYYLLGVSLLLGGCATVNVRNITDSKTFSFEEDEQRIWRRCEEIQKVFSNSGFMYGDEELDRYLTAIANELLAQYMPQNSFPIEVKVLNDPDFNAAMFANGTIYLHTGLLANMDNEAQIAVVLAHELVHFTNRHTLKSFRSIINKSAFFNTLSTLTALAPAGGAAVLGNIFLQTAFLSSVTGYSRELETEADTVGFLMFVKKYDIDEATKAFENLERAIKEQDIKTSYFFSTHPNVKSRRDNFKKLGAEYKQKEEIVSKEVNKERYEEKIGQLLLDNAQLDIRLNRFKSAERELNRFGNLYPQRVEGLYWLGELYRNKNEEGDKERAFGCYKSVIEKESSFYLAYKALGMMYYKDGQKEKARENLSTYLNLNPRAEDKDYVKMYLEAIGVK